MRRRRTGMDRVLPKRTQCGVAWVSWRKGGGGCQDALLCCCLHRGLGAAGTCACATCAELCVWYRLSGCGWGTRVSSLCLPCECLAALCLVHWLVDMVLLMRVDATN